MVGAVVVIPPPHSKAGLAIERILAPLRAPLRSLVVLAALGLISAPVAASGGKKCHLNDPQSCVQAVMAGEVVPFSGQLMTNRRAAKLVVTTEQCEDWRALDLEEAHELHQIQLQMVEEQRENDIKTHEMQLDLYRQREAELAPVWYEHPVFVAGTSVILTVALFSLAVKTVESLR